MVKPKDDIQLSLKPLSLTIDAGQDCSPVTPINRSFTNEHTSSFVTAILSPSSHDVFAARARARSRSDAPPLSSTAAISAASRAVHCSPSLDSISIARPCDTICESDTSPINVDNESNTFAHKPLYESPSIARRSRLLSSTGANVDVSLYDSFVPLTLYKYSGNELAKNEPIKEENLSSRFLSSRPRASTESIPSSSQFYPSTANLKLLHGSITPSAAVNSVSRLRTSSHYGQARSSSHNDEASSKDTYSSLFNLSGLAHFSTISSCNSDSNFRPLSTQSSHGSLNTRYNSSFESSFGVNDLSMTLSNTFSETFDISNDTIGYDSASWRSLQQSLDSMEMECDEGEDNIFKVSENVTGASSAVSIASHSTLNIITGGDDIPGRRKSHTISGVSSPHCIALQEQRLESQDVFGPTTTLDIAGQGKDQQQQPNSPLASTPASHQLWTSKSNSQLNVARENKPRRLTMTGGTPSTMKNNSRIALYSAHKPTIPLNLTRTPAKNRTPIISIADPVSPDQSLTAFQELIGAIRNERPIKSMAIEEVTSAEPHSIGAILEYRRCSPTGQLSEESAQKCQLCGSLARRLTMLEPCGHLACAVCCSSGLNQVTATPPRPHVCGSCHTPVQGITLRRERIDYDAHGTPLQTPRGPRYRPQTPSPDEQRLLYRHPGSSSPAKIFPKHGSAANGDQRRRDTSHCIVSNHKLAELTNTSGETSSSDLLTEDQSFYQSQRAIVHQQQQHATPRRLLPNHSLASTASPRGHQINETVMIMREQGTLRSTTAQGTSVIRIDNIPWTLTYNDLIEWLPQPADNVLPDADVSSASIHIPVDVFTGKTSNCCFIECKNKEEAMRLVRHRNNNRLLGRPVSLMITTFEDLLNEIFPARLESPSLKDNECIFFTAIHLRQLAELLKKGGVQLKGPLKIVDVTTSMIRLVPANMSRALSDMLFHRAIEIVCICIAASQDMPAIRQSLDRLLLACSSCACFSVNQRIEILDSARGTLTAVTQVQQTAAPFPVAPLSFASHPISYRSRMPTMEDNLNGTERVTTWQANQRSRLSSEAALAKNRPSLGSSAFDVDSTNLSMSWPSPISPVVEKRTVHPSPLLSSLGASGYASINMTNNISSPPRQRSLHQPSSRLDPSYREVAIQSLLRCGVDPMGISEGGFEKMVNQVAQALAEQQQLKP